VVLVVIVPFELTTRVQVGGIVPLKMTFPVADKAGAADNRTNAKAENAPNFIATTQRLHVRSICRTMMVQNG
jgi:hypothetical protein